MRQIVTAITAPSAMSSTSYQTYKFIDYAILKYTASVDLFAKHRDWPEVYFSRRRDSLVSNNNLERRQWTPARISDVE